MLADLYCQDKSSMKSEKLSPEKRREISKLGGLSTAKRMTQEERTLRAQKAANARWSGTGR